MKRRLELSPVVGLDHLHQEWEPLEHVVDESDRRLLVEPIVDTKHPQASAVIDGRELVVLLPSSLERRDELDVDLDPMARLLFSTRE